MWDTVNGKKANHFRKKYMHLNNSERRPTKILTLQWNYG